MWFKCQTIQTIQFNISTQFSSIWPLDGTLSGATTPGWPGSDGNEEVLCIPQSSIITGTSPSAFSSVIIKSYLSAEMQSVYSTTQAN